MIPGYSGATTSQELLKLDNQFCFALHAAARLVVRSYGPVLRELDLTYPQYLVLLVLWEWDRERQARPTVTALGERLELDSGTLTPLLRRLEQKGLITRERAVGDERERLLRVTRSGRALRKSARRVPLVLLEESPLPVDELLELRDRLKALRTRLAQQSAPSEP